MNPASLRPLPKPTAPRALLSAEPSRINAITGDGGCSAVAVSGQAAEPAISLMNSRRLIASPGSERVIEAAQTCTGKGPVHVRFGSKADIRAAKTHVRFTPKSGHSAAQTPCLLRA